MWRWSRGSAAEADREKDGKSGHRYLHRIPGVSASQRISEHHGGGRDIRGRVGSMYKINFSGGEFTK